MDWETRLLERGARANYCEDQENWPGIPTSRPGDVQELRHHVITQRTGEERYLGFGRRAPSPEEEEEERWVSSLTFQ